MTGMWACPACGRSFANRNQVHTCAALGDLDRHFAGTSPQVRATFDAVLAAAAGFGPVEVLAEKTRIALQVRMSMMPVVFARRDGPGNRTDDMTGIRAERSAVFAEHVTNAVVREGKPAPERDVLGPVTAAGLDPRPDVVELFL